MVNSLQTMLNSRVIFVNSQDEIEKVVTTMREKNISSVLVTDSDENVVGIVTERDIVQKFTLLEKQDKLTAKVAAFMTRPVHFAKLSMLEKDVRSLFLNKKIRHFPVLIDQAKVSDVLGILTVTDISRAYFRAHKDDEKPALEKPLALIAKKAYLPHYEKLLKALKFSVFTEGTPEQIVKSAISQASPILIDIDGYGLEECKSLLTLVKKITTPIMLLSSDSTLVNGLKKALTRPSEYIAMKPLDISSILEIIDRIDP